ncbi:MAG: hypothetical protein EOO07_08450 [Chitinophagaceae bacterium]|nr:MAG: hypothetical protein EOO07_08450 [Chitinophagaceae bacterium]
MKKNRVLQIALLLCAQSNTNTALALDLYSLSTSDFEYLADLFKNTTSGKAYFIKAFGSHSNIWKEAINKCGAPIKDQPFYFKVNLTLEPSGKPKLLSFDRPFAGDAKLSQFSQCLGIHLMESNYPPHKFPVYFFQFLFSNP